LGGAGGLRRVLRRYLRGGAGEPLERRALCDRAGGQREPRVIPAGDDEDVAVVVVGRARKRQAPAAGGGDRVGRRIDVLVELPAGAPDQDQPAALRGGAQTYIRE